MEMEAAGTLERAERPASKAAAFFAIGTLALPLPCAVESGA